METQAPYKSEIEVPEKFTMAYVMIMRTASYKNGSLEIVVLPGDSGLKVYSTRSVGSHMLATSLPASLEDVGYTSYYDYDPIRDKVFLRVI